MLSSFKKIIVCLLFVVSVFVGCNGANGTRSAQIVTLPQPGSPQPFTLHIVNSTQWPIVPGVSVQPGGLGLPITGSQVVIIYPGTQLDFQVNYLPSSIQVDAVIFGTPPFYQYPSQFLLLGRDFGFYSTDATVSYY